VLYGVFDKMEVVLTRVSLPVTLAECDRNMQLLVVNINMDEASFKDTNFLIKVRMNTYEESFSG
jgi:hypothetical protein